MCIKCILNCELCNVENTCIKCLEGYALNKENKCILCSLIIPNCDKCFFGNSKHNFNVTPD